VATLPTLADEGFDEVLVLRAVADVDMVTIGRESLRA
jgi:hypothetical protein